MAVVTLVAVAAAVLIGLRSLHQGPARSKTTATPPATATAGKPTSFFVIQMFTDRTGWALTDKGLFRTVDGWKHWLTANPAGVALGGGDNADFLSESTAWVASIKADDPHHITVLRTVDAGRTWQQTSITDLNSAGPAQLDFVDAVHGWLLVGYGSAASNEGVALYRTSDGGQHWVRIEQTLGLGHDAPGSLPFGCGKAGISFVSLTTGWVSGNCAAGGAFLAVTHDGGFTWQSQTLPGTEGVVYQGPATTLPTFFSARDGYLVFFEGSSASTLYTTTDGGRTWQPRPLPRAIGGVTPTVFFQSMDNGWIISQDGGLVYQTTDGGREWMTFTPRPALKEVGSVDFLDSQRGFAEAISSGNQSVLLRTVDGGRSWQQVAP
jgi:photosystem II stability/assembly factor-like uncharacterized protein